MKAIQPINVWVDGETKQANQFTLIIVFDNLDTEAMFSYVLGDSDNNAFISGKLPIDGNDYQNWAQSLDSNSDAYVYAANALNLTLI